MTVRADFVEMKMIGELYFSINSIKAFVTVLSSNATKSNPLSDHEKLTKFK